MLIDSHAHLDMPAFNGDRDQVLTRARKQGVSAIINVGVDLESSRASLNIAQRHPDIFTTVGFQGLFDISFHFISVYMTLIRFF